MIQMTSQQVSLLKGWLSKLDLDPSLLGALSPRCALQPMEKDWHTYEFNTFVLGSAIFYHSCDGSSKRIFKEYRQDFGNWSYDNFNKTSKVFLEALKNTLRYRGVNLVELGSVRFNLGYNSKREAAPDWDKEDLKRSFKDLSLAFQQEVIADKLLPEDILAALVTKYSQLIVKEADASAEEHIQDEVKSETKLETLPLSNATVRSTMDVTRLDKTIELDRTKADCLISFAQVWRSENDYTGDLFDNLDYKIIEFKWCMNILQIKSENWPCCFKFILRKQADCFARDSFKDEWAFDQMVEALKDQFETAERKQLHRFIWANITFKSVVSENPTKSKSDNLQLLITKLRKCQYALGGQYAADIHIVDCLLRACRDEPDLAMVYGSMPKSFEAVCAVFHKALEGNSRFQSTTSILTEEYSSSD
ncbi:uncharacterized protein FA14DRAFT_174772 [Meira miltonrushii]|uniref:Uncharacterized protein n=1 Tax=Meira miltonrushii TaxID=1280837 RepID=A0A316V4F2_9BASI|nr:uncharacterized protein FA14DRAFT_174772 [Meira miltonrushii]PWN31888.1 hypothetical protein FA14DRAFT_174772 [Meira miltonrushii]